MSKINGKTALVTGANRGIGRAFVETLLAQGASKIYATARNTASLDDLVAQSGGRVVAVQLDVTEETQVAQVAAAYDDVDLLINNAGVAAFEGLVAANSAQAARQEMETNYFGSFNMIRAYAPVLARQGGGAIINMASIASHVNFPALGSYSASKAAVHSLTQGVRAELAAQGTQVVGVYPGPVDTDMAASFPMDKTAPSAVVAAVFSALEAGEEDIYPDPMAQDLQKSMLADMKSVERQIGEMLPG
ncbi:SDR family oxidoreductase [Rhodovibrionaceae bacterium A322]